MEDLIFSPLQVRCPDCTGYVEASIEDLQYDEELTCLQCRHKFTPAIDAESLIKLMHLAENGEFKQKEYC
jgi:hypothetical protein